MTAASKAAGGPQRLVEKGYRNQHRRIYLLRLKDDRTQQLSAVTPALKFDLASQRLQNWERDGVLAIGVFNHLIGEWINTKTLASRSNTHSESAPYSVDIGLTFTGLQTLQIQDQLLDILRGLAPAFSQGAHPRASAYLGDTGPSDPSHWLARYSDSGAHAVIFVHTEHEPIPGQFSAFEIDVNAALVADPAAPAIPPPLLQRSWIEQSTLLANNWRHVHFGYTDGISAPNFKPLKDLKALPAPRPVNDHATGELLLGYDRNDGSNAWTMPGALPQSQGSVAPHARPDRAAFGAFFRDGSFGVLRKMQQNVAAFEKYLSDQADFWRYNWDKDDTVAWLKAKMLGRWPDGTPVSAYDGHPGGNRPTIAQRANRNHVAPTPQVPTTSNDFDYKQDQLGFGCPIGAHMRRMNPRADTVVPFLRRPLLRRGMPYGRADASDVGMLGLFFCTSLEEQFEHLVGKWANDTPMGMPQGKDSKDPLTGQQDVFGAVFDIPAPQSNIQLTELPAFVKTLGTCYAFFPSVGALQAIAAGQTASYTRMVERPCA